MVYELEAESEAIFGGEIEVDERYFIGKRKGKPSPDAARKVPTVGSFKRTGKIYTTIIPDALGVTLIPIIEGKVVADRIRYFDCWSGYNVLYVSEFHRFHNVFMLLQRLSFGLL